LGLSLRDSGQSRDPTPPLMTKLMMVGVMDSGMGKISGRTALTPNFSCSAEFQVNGKHDSMKLMAGLELNADIPTALLV
jgi:hypothetical protein